MNSNRSVSTSPSAQLHSPAMAPVRRAVTAVHATHKPLRQTMIHRNGFRFLRLEGSFAEVCAALDKLCALES